MNETTILVIEDDKTIQNFMKISLKTRGYSYILADNGLSGISLFYANHPDLILLDLGLPDIDGMEVLKQIRKQSNTPVIVVSARGQEREKINALDQGADDYVTKPFSAEELLARIRVGLRHKDSFVSRQEQEFELDYFRMDFEKRKVYVHDQEIHLTPLEYKMMVLLVNNSGKVLTHHYIQQEVWGYDTTDDYQSLRVFMANIRRKIEDNTANPRFLFSVWGGWGIDLWMNKVGLMLKAGVRGYAASAFVCLHGGRAGRKAGLRFLVPGGWSANSKRGWKQGTVSTTGKS